MITLQENLQNLKDLLDGKEIEFKDLGLLIIDEEHRFGVKAKEKIKEYKTCFKQSKIFSENAMKTLYL